jgi:hypothetical protein
MWGHIIDTLSTTYEKSVDAINEIKYSSYGTVAEWTLKYLINKYNFNLERYGNMSELKINTDDKKITLTLDLKGEDHPIYVEAKYKLEHLECGEPLMKIEDVDFSREWLKNLFDDYVPKENLEFPIPSNASGLLKVLGI